jgi:hypothetical protein
MVLYWAVDNWGPLKFGGPVPSITWNTSIDGPVWESEAFRSIENKIFPMSTNKNKPRSDLRDAKQ